MKLFDTYVEQTAGILGPWMEAGRAAAVEAEGPFWPVAEKNPFLMERDTALELGGYPKESVNLVLSSAADLPADGSWIIGAAAAGEAHCSFGRIVFLQTEEIADDAVYDFQQQVQVADLRLKLDGVMTRTSSRQYQMNLRIGKKAAGAGLNLEAMARTMREYFLKLPGVKNAAVILLAGDSPLYRQLLPVAEKVKEVTVALNTMFEGIDMDCGSCSPSEICDEVEGLREMHRAKQKN